jgi:hypothetical protein
MEKQRTTWYVYTDVQCRWKHNQVFEVTSIMGINVEIQPFRKCKLLPQCKQCQAYGHTQRYCNKDPRCVKCAGKHHIEECRKPKEAQPKCVHCGEAQPKCLNCGEAQPKCLHCGVHAQSVFLFIFNLNLCHFLFVYFSFIIAFFDIFSWFVYVFLELGR